MISNLKLLIIQSEWNTFKWAVILDMKRKIYGDKRANRKEFEQTTQTEVVKEDFLKERTLQLELEKRNNWCASTQSAREAWA